MWWFQKKRVEYERQESECGSCTMRRKVILIRRYPLKVYFEEAKKQAPSQVLNVQS